ncbi:Autophagy-related protein [Sarcoptes scabiei]|uniref:Autophagy-related protein 101 n=1 Tax=Sarcoptes scabiei TaxID=52283 RepID=A0A834VC03_SARSC|nr:Autophagy-related protein [Sarcoptes scabiei]UXI15135.1 ribosome maturation protein [Sarcoptes scabiei]
MNYRHNSFEFTCLEKKIAEIVSVIFHSVIFNRCVGKFNYRQDDSYSVGSLTFEEVICEFLDFTYVRVASYELTKLINQNIKMFADELRMFASDGPRSIFANQAHRAQPSIQMNRKHSLNTVQQKPSIGQKFPHSDLIPTSLSDNATGSISLEFNLKNKNRRFTFSDALTWEVWTLKINCLNDYDKELLLNKSSIEDQLFDKILSIVSIVNNSNAFLPSMPIQSELDNVFDTSYPDAQPYNFKISYKIGSDSNGPRSSDHSSRGGFLGPGQEKLKKLFEKLSL